MTLLTAEEKRERKRASDRAHYQKNRAKILANVRQWTEANRDRVREYQRKYRLTDRGKQTRHSARVNNREKIMEWDRIRSRVDTAPPARLKRTRELIAAWGRRNRDKRSLSTMRRKARERGQGGNFSVEDWKHILEKFGGRCLKCGTTEKLEPDHVMPLSLGGLHDPSNIQPLCGPCNRRKSAKHIDYRGADYGN